MRARRGKAGDGMHRALQAVGRGSRAGFVLRGLGVGMGFALNVALARWMGAAEFGIYAYVLAWVGLLAVPALFGVPTLLVRFVPVYHVEAAWGRWHGLLRWGLRYVVGLSVLLAATAALVVGVLGDAVPAAYHRPLLVGLWLTPLHALASYAAGLHQARHRIGRARTIPVLRHALTLALAFALLAFTGRLTGLAGLMATMAAAGVVLLMQLPLVRGSLPAAVWQAAPVYEAARWRATALPMLLIAGFTLLMEVTDVLMVGSLLGPHEAGIYRVATRTAALVSLVLLAVGEAAAPMLATLHARNDRAALQRLASATARWMFWPALGAFVLLGVLAEPVLRLFGPDFVEARTVLVVLAFGQLVNAATGAAGWLLTMTGHQRQEALVQGGGVVINVVLNLAGILWLGVLGAALATAFTLALTQVVLSATAYRRLGIHTSILGIGWSAARQAAAGSRGEGT